MKQNLVLFNILLLIVSGCTTNESTTEGLSNESYTVIAGGNKVGYLKVNVAGDSLYVDYDYKNNGRGPTIKEIIRLNEDGFPTQWDIKGNATFGNAIDEHFLLKGSEATWADATGTSNSKLDVPTLYINQNGSPFSLGLVAKVLLRDTDHKLPALPAGELRLIDMESFELTSDSAKVTLKSYALEGAGLNPTYFVMDGQRLFAYITPGMVVVRSGFEKEEKGLRLRSAKYAEQRYQGLQNKFAHRFEGTTRIKNVRIFDPKTLSLTPLSSVLVINDRIKSIDSPNAETSTNETVIDGNGGTLVPGLYDMHGHMSDNAAILNVLAGVTSVRDMGNNNEVLDTLIQKIESGIMAGPRITRLGFIEGKSPYNANGGIIVESQQQAIAAVEKYASMGYHGIKLYNSMNGDWAPAIVKRAHELNMPVCGHVPAFSNANAMLRAGFDEMTHINQVMLGWVLKPEEDTRTLLRLTALQRLPGLDLNSAAVNETLSLMVKNKVAMDPTLVIHESLLLSRNGQTRRGTTDYIDHMPSSVQRDNKQAMASIASEQEDANYKQAYDKIVEVLKKMKSLGITIVPGTDMGGAFTVHRELELYEQLGYTPAELLKLGSYDMAAYLGHTDRGIIEPGMLADFFLIPDDPTKNIKAIKTISLVSRGGRIYFPTEVYPSFGIKPFTEMPVVIIPKKQG